MKIQDMKSPKGTRRPKRRKGRGMGSGRGKTGGRGSKGQKSRSGSKRAFGFEGGQMPLMRRIPKRGFRPRGKKEYSIINLEKLNIFKEGTHVTPFLLKDKRLIKTIKKPIKILGKGKLKKKLAVNADSFSMSAKAAIEKIGGSITVIARGKKVP